MRYTYKIEPNGTKEWFLNGILHREDGPAIEWPHGAKDWYFHGDLHRESGPAIEEPNGYKAWWLNNRLMGEWDEPENWDELVVLAQVERIMND